MRTHRDNSNRSVVTRGNLMRTAALIVATLAVLGVLTACTNAPASAPSRPVAATTTAAAPTTDPLAGFLPTERAFIGAYKAAGFSNSGGNSGIVQLGQAICGDIVAGSRPAQTQASLVTPSGLTAGEAETLYILAHDVMCPSVPLPDPNSFGEGTYEVGVDIQPGRYRSPGGDNCYWARLDDSQDILDNNISSGPNVFDVRESDGFIELSRCTWTLNQ